MADNTTAFISEKPHPVPIEMRPLWRISLLAIIVSIVGREDKGISLNKVNILVWMLIRKRYWPAYEAFLDNRNTNIPLVSVDTATFKALEFARAKSFLEFDGIKVRLDVNGEELVSILNENELMSEERTFLLSWGKKLTELKVKELSGGR